LLQENKYSRNAIRFYTILCGINLSFCRKLLANLTKFFHAFAQAEWQSPASKMSNLFTDPPPLPPLAHRYGPQDGRLYSDAIEHLCPTEGAMSLLRVLAARSGAGRPREGEGSRPTPPSNPAAPPPPRWESAPTPRPPEAHCV